MDAVTCPACNMSFASQGQMQRHRSQSCLGPMNPHPVVSELERLKQSKAEQRRLKDKQERDLIRGGSQPLPERVNTASTALGLNDSDNEELASPHASVRQSAIDRQLKTQAQEHSRHSAEYRKTRLALEMQKKQIEQRLNAVQQAQSFTQRDNATFMGKLSNKHEQNALAMLKLKQEISASLLPDDEELLKEIIATREKYLAHGGNNPQILINIAEMEKQALLTAMKRRQKSKQKDLEAQGNLNEQLTALEKENRQLHEELIGLHRQNTERVESEAEALAEQNELLLRNAFLSESARREQEAEAARRDEQLHALKRKLEQLELTLASQQTLNPPATHVNNSFRTAVTPVSTGRYNPDAGFMVFFDFVTGLASDTTAVQLSLSFYTSQGPLAPVPTLLPTVRTTRDAGASQLGTVAMLSTKQPIQSCRPSWDLGMVLELRTSGQDGRLRPTAWCKVHVFDADSLLSGRWKVQFRSLPAEPCATKAELQAMYELHAADVYIRIVNYLDAEKQGVMYVSLSDCIHYRTLR